jgi:multiple sugar transport system substrate-binding protein
MTYYFSRRGFLGTAALAGAAVAMPGLAACGADSASSNGPSGATPKGELTIMASSGDLTDDNIKAFNKVYPDVKVTRVDLEQTKLLAMIAAGNMPDLVETVGVWDAPYYAARGNLEPLGAYLDKAKYIKVDDLDPVNDIYKYDGKKSGHGAYQGLCKDYSQDGTLWANKAIFDGAKVALPSTETPLTYDELLEIGRKLTKRSGGKTEVYGLGAVGSPSLLKLIPAVESTGSSLWSDDFSEIDFTSTEGLKALEFYWNVGKEGLAPGPLAMSNDADDALFKAGRMGLLMFGYWFSGSLADSTKSLQDSAYLLPAPQLGSNRVSPTYYGVGMSMSSSSKNKDAAWAFFDFFIGGPPAQERAKAGWGLPAFKSLRTDLPQALPYQQRALEVQTAEEKFMSVLPFSPYATNGQLQTILDDEFKATIGKGQLSTFAQTITDKCNQILSEGRSQVS